MDLIKIETGLIPVYENEQRDPVVNARELHGFLEINSKFADWIKNRIEKYGFVEGQDFITISNILENGGRTIEYILKLDTAKEIAMVENNIRGSQIRRYFIAVEKKYKQITDTSKLPPELQMFKQLFDSVARAHIQLNEVNEQVQIIKDTIMLQPDNWRDEINRMFNRVVEKVGGSKFQVLRTESYNMLDERAHVDTSDRLRRLKKRLEESGATKTKISNTGKLDVIESDPKLREIYTTIIKELTIKYVA